MNKQEPVSPDVVTIRYGKAKTKVSIKRVIGGVMFGVPLTVMVIGAFMENPLKFILAVLVIAVMVAGLLLLDGNG